MDLENGEVCKWGRSEGAGDIPILWYSSMVFFSPTLKPSVDSGRSSFSLLSLDAMLIAVRFVLSAAERR